VSRNEGTYVVRPNGSTVRRVTRLLTDDLDWSIRGQVAFTRKRGRAFDVFAVPARGGRVRRLTRGGVSLDPSWSPDGRRLAFSKFTPNDSYAVGVFVARADGSGLRQIARGANSPVWSPDGTRIAYTRGSRLVVARPDGSARRVIERVAQGSIQDPTWQALRTGR